jgi:hypothetical protein
MSHTSVFYIPRFNIKIVNVKKGSLRFLFYLPLEGFCNDMPEDGLSTGRNMWHTCKGNKSN